MKKNQYLVLVLFIISPLSFLQAQKSVFDMGEGSFLDNFPALMPNVPKINKPNIATYAGLSVNSFSGSLFYSRHDLFIPGRGLSLDLTFYYNSSNSSLDMGYGPGWSMTYSMKCIPGNQSVVLRMPDGQKRQYLQNGSLYTAPKGIYDSLSQYQPGKYLLRTKNGVQYYFDDSTHHGLTGITDRNGNTISISYGSGGLPVSITDASGRVVQLSYSNAHLVQISDQNVSPARTILFQYDGAGNPVMVTDPLGYTTQYQYDAVHNLTMLTDQAGTPYQVSYLNCATVETVSSPLSTRRFRFNAGALQCIDSIQVSGAWQTNVSTYDSNGNLVEKTANCCGYHWLCEYDSLNNLTKMTDAKGYAYHFGWDGKGNLTSSTNPMQGTRVYQYEPQFHLPTYFKNENNQVTTFTYDASGNLVQLQKPLGVTESRTYTANGQVATYTDGKGYTTAYTYNGNGDLIMIQKPLGHTETFLYDNAGNCISMTDANGHTRTVTYDPLNRKVQEQNALGQVTLLQYDARGLLLSITDPSAHAVSNTYDALGRIIQRTTAAGTEFFTYDAFGNIKTHQDAKGNVMLNTFDNRNRLIAQTNALGKTRSNVYDVNGNKTDDYDYNGNHREYMYDTLNRLVRQTDPMNHNTWFTYDALGNRVSVTDANAHTTTFSYDALNRLTLVQRPIGQIQFGYDANNNRTSISDANAHSTFFAYDSLNRLKSVTDPLMHHSGYSYDGNGNCLTDTDRNGHITQHIYDAMDRRIKSISPTGVIDSLCYNADGLCVIRQVGGSLVWYTYDDLHRLTGMYDSIGTIVTYAYDANSNCITVKIGNGDSSRYTYDSIDRVKTMIDPAGSVTAYHYDNNSNLLLVIDRVGDTTQFVYDADDRLVTTISPMGFVSTQTYDAAGNILAITDPKSHTTTLGYDANDRLLTETLANGNVRSYTYDAGGNCSSRTNFNGVQTHYTYNANDQLVMRNYPGTNDDVFSYDNEGNLLTANNSNAGITFTYDNDDRILSETLNGKTVSYSYDIPNRKRTVTYPGGRAIEYHYDQRLRLAGLRENNASLAANTFDAADNLLATSLRNGVTENYAYDANQWISSLNQKRGVDTVTAFTYQRNAIGNIQSVNKKHHPANSEQYTYDKNSRLTQYKEGMLSAGNIATPVVQTQYTFDSAGNRSTVVQTTAAAGTANNYVFTTGTATLDLMSGATTILNANNDDNPSVLIPIGFAFQYEGVSYNAFSVSPDGFMRLGTMATAEPANNMVSLNNRPRIMPMWDNLATGINGSVKVLVSGVAGSRILKLQWSVTIPRNLPGSANSVFQVWLYETTGVIEFRYGTGGHPVGGATIGIIGASVAANQYISVSSNNHTASTTTPNNSNILWPGSTRFYRFTPQAGSVTSTTNYFSNIVDQYTAINLTNPVYDANGNTLNDGIRTYQYDDENRYTVVNPSTLISTTSLYDALGRRIQKSNTTGTIQYYYDGDRVIEERNNANTVQATYAYQEQETLAASDKEICCFNMQRGGNDYFIHRNAIGSTVAVTDMNGNVAERYEYNEYGKPVFFDAVYGSRTATAIGNTYLFAGMQYNVESGTYHVKPEGPAMLGYFDGFETNADVYASIYNPGWGRYAQRNAGIGTNSYTYAGNNPVNLSQDPLYVMTANGVSESQSVNFYGQADIRNGELIEDVTINFSMGPGEGLDPVSDRIMDANYLPGAGIVKLPLYANPALQGYYWINMRRWWDPGQWWDPLRKLLTKLFPGSDDLLPGRRFPIPPRPKVPFPPRPKFPPLPPPEPDPLPPVNIEDIAFNGNFLMNPNQAKIPARRGVSGAAVGFDKIHQRDIAWAWYRHQLVIWIATGRHGPPPSPPRNPNKLFPNK